MDGDLLFQILVRDLRDPWGLPSVWLVQNYAAAWDRGISDYFVNSVIVTIISTVATVAIAALCAYGMVRLSSRVANIVLIVAMGGLVVAPQVSLIPLYRLLDTMGLLNTYWAMILPYVAFRLPMAILLIRSVFLGIPRELEDAATIDGCRSFGVFRHVYLPLSASVLTTAAVLTGYFAWNEFLFAIVYIDADALRTIPAGLMSFRDSLSTEWGVLLAGLTIAALPSCRVPRAAAVLRRRSRGGECEGMTMDTGQLRDALAAVPPPSLVGVGTTCSTAICMRTWPIPGVTH
ncbi:carbohydrate ABC transporter permease [Microbacterium sp. NRRL B-14842]|uniref:carbohydrate ABC transporter permease n=1 Tax=Microbacterium sp. NRRL B-14842 TaxID=3162881 RepID=UPI003D2D228B